ncbi:GDSL-type esterase/lipase family protein [Vibrio olivae]|uniref:GDSL-type esterase/lipase family protein n=1 Tax=Vibrio olivae TaxID=1243002 RepID=A0ABV5HMT6_9VIBR
MGIYGVASWAYVLPGFHYAQAELRRLYHGDSYETQHYQKRMESFSKRKDEIAASDVLFVGDSITEGFDLDKYVKHPNVINLGISGDTSLGVINRIDLLKNKKNAIVFLMIGVNDLGMNVSINNIEDNIIHIIDDLKDNGSFIVIQSVLLTDGRKRDNHKIFLLNQKISQLSKQRGIAYLDLNPFMVKNGKLNPEFTYDGLHLNEDGYNAWAYAINVFLNAMIKG